MEGGKVVRSSVDEVNLTGRNTQGVRFVRPDNGDRVIAMAPHFESDAESCEDEADEDLTSGDQTASGEDLTSGEDSTSGDQTASSDNDSSDIAEPEDTNDNPTEE